MSGVPTATAVPTSVGYRGHLPIAVAVGSKPVAVGLQFTHRTINLRTGCHGALSVRRKLSFMISPGRSTQVCRKKSLVNRLGPLIREPEFAFRVIVNLLGYRQFIYSNVPLGIPQKGGKVDGAILDDYALKNGA